MVCWDIITKFVKSSIFELKDDKEFIDTIDTKFSEYLQKLYSKHKLLLIITSLEKITKLAQKISKGIDTGIEIYLEPKNIKTDTTNIIGLFPLICDFFTPFTI